MINFFKLNTGGRLPGVEKGWELVRKMLHKGEFPFVCDGTFPFYGGWRQ